MPLAFAWAILKYKLLGHLASSLRDSYRTYSLTLPGPASSASRFLEILVLRGVPETAGLTRNLLSVAAVLVVGGLLAPARQGISSTLERVQYRQSFTKRRTLTRLGRELLHDRDLESLASKLLAHLEEALGLELTNLLITEGEHLVPLRHEDPDIGELVSDFLFDDFWAAPTISCSRESRCPMRSPHRHSASSFRATATRSP